MNSTLPNHVGDGFTKLPRLKPRNSESQPLPLFTHKQNINSHMEFPKLIGPTSVSEDNRSSKSPSSLCSFILGAVLTVTLVIVTAYLLSDDVGVTNRPQVGTMNLIATLDNRFLAVDSLDSDTKIKAVEAALEPLLQDMDVKVNVEYNSSSKTFTFVYSKSSISLSNVKFYLKYDKRLDLAVDVITTAHNSRGVIYFHGSNRFTTATVKEAMNELLDEAKLLYADIGTLVATVSELNELDPYIDGDHIYWEADAELMLSLVDEDRHMQLKLLRSMSL
ncbi:hypothetical protein P9112_014406 [Eukaryota sp. TZLM1-RC]